MNRVDPEVLAAVRAAEASARRHLVELAATQGLTAHEVARAQTLERHRREEEAEQLAAREAAAIASDSPLLSSEP